MGTTGAAAPADTYSCYPTQGFASLANYRYVSAELGYTGGDYAMLRARQTSVGRWEEWEFCFDQNLGQWSFFNNQNLRWVSTEVGYTGNRQFMLRARQTSPGPWERYTIYCVGGVPGNFAIQSDYEGTFTSAQLDYTGSYYAMLRARAFQVQAWETFGYFPGC